MNVDKALIRQIIHHIIVNLYLKVYNYPWNGVVFEYLNDSNLDIQSEWISNKIKITVTINE